MTVYIDIREWGEWRETGIIEGSETSTMIVSSVNTWLQEGSDFLGWVTDKNQSFTLICASGGRAEGVASALDTEGYTKVHYLIGGIAKWMSEENTVVPVN